MTKNAPSNNFQKPVAQKSVAQKAVAPVAHGAHKVVKKIKEQVGFLNYLHDCLILFVT